MKAPYTAKATSTGGRTSHSATDDGVLDVTLTEPREKGGTGAPGTNPKQLFAVGHSACFLGPVKAASRKADVKVPEASTVTAKASFLDRADAEGFWIKAALEINLPGIDQATTEDLVRRALVICPFSEVSRKGFEVSLDAV